MRQLAGHLLVALVVASPVAQALGDGRTTEGRVGREVVVLVPLQAERVDHVQAELGGTADRVAEGLGPSPSHEQKASQPSWKSVPSACCSDLCTQKLLPFESEEEEEDG